MPTIRFPSLAVLCASMLTLMVLGADAPTQTVEVEGLSFQVPDSWKKAKLSSPMRKAQLEAPPVEGDKQPAVLAVFIFPESAGTVAENVERWRSQFKSKDGQAVKADVKTVKGKNVDVTRVEVAGTYTDPFGGKGPQPAQRLLGAIVETKQAAYFLRMVGPEATMHQAESGFDDLIKSMAIAGR